MKKFLVLVMLLGFSFIQLKAQQYTRPAITRGYHPGTVTMPDCQVQSGYILYGYNNPQNECVFYADYKDGRSKRTYKPKEIAAYSVENSQYKSVPYSGNISFGKPGKQFLYIVKPGAINSMVYFIEGEEQPVWQRGNDEPVSNASLLFGFKKNVLKLISDNAELSGKIERAEKGYGMLGLDKIVDEYNAWAAMQVK